MLREEMIKRLEELPDLLIDSKEVYNFDVVAKTIQMTWDNHAAYFLTEFRQDTSDCEFIRFIYKGWRICMELPTQSALDKETQPCP